MQMHTYTLQNGMVARAWQEMNRWISTFMLKLKATTITHQTA